VFAAQPKAIAAHMVAIQATPSSCSTRSRRTMSSGSPAIPLRSPPTMI